MERISSVSASAASMQSLRLTSRCVTTRTAPGPNAPTRTPRAFSRAASSPAPFPAASRKMTMLVSTEARSIHNALGVRQRFGQQARVGVILREPLWTLFERNQSCRGQHSRLPHAAAQCFSINASARDQLRRTHQHRSHRRAQTFRQTKHHRVESARQRLHIHAQRNSRVKDARAVKCVGSLWAFAPLQISSKTSTRVQTPPARLAVFSISINPVAARKPP